MIKLVKIYLCISRFYRDYRVIITEQNNPWESKHFVTSSANYIPSGY